MWTWFAASTVFECARKSSYNTDDLADSTKLECTRKSAYAAAQLCDTYGGAWSRSAQRANVAGTCGYCDNSGVHPSGSRTFEAGTPGTSSTWTFTRDTGERYRRRCCS